MIPINIESSVVIICIIYIPPVIIYTYSAMNSIQNKREHILNKQQQRLLKKNLLLVTPKVSIILGECKLYI